MVFTKVSWVCKKWCHSITECMDCPQYNICTLFFWIYTAEFLRENTAEPVHNISDLLQHLGKCSTCWNDWTALAMATEHSFCGGSYLHHCRHECRILNFPAPSAPSLSYWIFLRTMNRTVWPFFLSCYLVCLASSAFCRLNLFAFLEYNTKIQLWQSLESAGNIVLVPVVSPGSISVFLLLLEPIVLSKIPSHFSVSLSVFSTACETS